MPSVVTKNEKGRDFRTLILESCQNFRADLIEFTLGRRPRPQMHLVRPGTNGEKKVPTVKEDRAVYFGSGKEAPGLGQML
jgi:hypothetical protein